MIHNKNYILNTNYAANKYDTLYDSFSNLNLKVTRYILEF